MFSNYFKIAWRNLMKNKIYASINIIGLTIGLTACLLLATVIMDDLSYDTQWKNAKNIYRVISINKNNQDATENFPLCFTGLGPTLKKYFPEVKSFCRMRTTTDWLKMDRDKGPVKFETIHAEHSVWDLLDFKIMEGNPQKYVKGYANLVITSKIRRLYFPGSDPVGKIIYDIPAFNDPKPFIITGVIKEIPANTHLRADLLILEDLPPADDELFKQEYGSFTPQYLLLQKDISAGDFTKKINNWYRNDFVGKKSTYSFAFQPMTDIYLKSDFKEDQAVQGNITNTYIFSAVALMILLIACINFINLTTARALLRIKETGVRKVLGAKRRQLVIQFLLESLLFFCISFILSIVLYVLFIQSVQTYIGHPLTRVLSGSPGMFLSASSIVFAVSIFTGLYPAWILSRPDPAIILKGKLSEHPKGSWLRKGLITGQFTISIMIILGAIIVEDQLHFLEHKDLGFDKNNLLKIDYTTWGNKGVAFKQDILGLAGVENASFSSWYPSGGGGSMSREINDPSAKDNKIKVWYIDGDLDLAKTLKLQLQSGRWLDKKFATDAINEDSLMQKSFDQLLLAQKTQAVLMTAYTADLLGDHSLGEALKETDGRPVGIVSNFYNESLHFRMKPCFIRAITTLPYGYLLVRVYPNDQQQVVAAIRRIWQTFYPNRILQYDWVSDLLETQYRAEKKLQELFSLFSLLTVFLACLGLFGLATFTSTQRIREVGIRKVLGASTLTITRLLSLDFLQLVGLSIVIASPIAWWAMNRWLQDYAYRIHIQWWVFVIAGSFALVISMATVSYQAIKAAMTNPVKSLRSQQ
jgi:putative ABC transport system permease protein